MINEQHLFHYYWLILNSQRQSGKWNCVDMAVTDSGPCQMSLQVYTCGDYVSKNLSSTPYQVLELLLGPTKLNCLSEVEYLNIWCFSFPVSVSPFSNNQAANINYDKCNWIVFKCLFHIGNWIKLQTSILIPDFLKGQILHWSQWNFAIDFSSTIISPLKLYSVFCWMPHSL